MTENSCGRGTREIPVFGTVPGVFLRIPHPKPLARSSGRRPGFALRSALLALGLLLGHLPRLLFFFEQEGFGVAVRRLLHRCRSQLDESSRRSIELGASLPETAGQQVGDLLNGGLISEAAGAATAGVTAGTGAMGSITGARIPEVTAGAGAMSSRAGVGAVSVTASTGAMGSITGARIAEVTPGAGAACSFTRTGAVMRRSTACCPIHMLTVSPHSCPEMEMFSKCS